VNSVFSNSAFLVLEKELGPDLFYKGLKLHSSGAVQNIQVYESVVTGTVKEGNNSYAVEIIALQDGAEMAILCECGDASKGSPCVHIAALIIAATAGDYDTLPGGAIVAQAATASPNPSLPLWPEPAAEVIEVNYRQLLGRLTVKEMREIAAKRAIPLGGIKRDVILETLVQNLLKPESLHHALDQLPVDSHRVLDFTLLLLSSPVESAGVDALIPYLDAALAPFQGGRSASLCLDELSKFGLIFFVANQLQIPVQLLGQPVINPGLFKSYEGEIERTESSQPYALTRLALRLVLLGQAGFLELEPLPGRKENGGWPLQIGDKPQGNERLILPGEPFLKAECLQGLSRITSEPEEKIDFIAHISSEGNFWEKRNPRKMSEHFTSWLQLTQQEQSRGLFWVAANLFTAVELDAARNEYNFSVWRSPLGLSLDQFLFHLAQDRLRLLGLLARAPTGQWLEIDTLLRVLHGLQPFWLPELYLRSAENKTRKLTSPLVSWIKTGNKTLNVLDYEAWSKTFGQFYVMALIHTFNWLDLCEVAWRYKQPVAFRISPFGEYLLGRRSSFNQPEVNNPSPAVRFEQDGSLWINPGQTDPQLINLVLLIGSPREHKRASDGKMPHDLGYDIHMQGLGHAFEAGWTLEQIVSILEGSMHQPLPAGLAANFQRIWERYGRLHIYSDIALIKFADDFCLPELLSNTSLNQILLFAFSPRVVAVRPDGVARWVDELRAKGYTPHLEGSSHVQ